MLRNTLMAAVVAIATGAAFMTPSEAAAPAVGAAPASSAIQASSKMVPAAYVKKHKRIVHHAVYGPRFRHRHGRYVYFHRGYWYAKPWWRHRTV